MNKLLGLLTAVGVFTILLTPSQANANSLSLFTEHQAVYMLRHGVNQSDDVRFPTGRFPYLGKVGVEYDRKRFSYSLSYIHRSNVDLHGNEYNYDGVSIGIKYKKCFIGCN
ncbi:hypothetical protein [Psychrobacter sp. HII-4]|uniref:hypothetical protein n=1 Tax=Psychrobacter sp. HII-4 TaxID=1569264 RepID=UPI001917FC11|nr:hypothetical protein [Psychrobacter sp. HII-4]